MEAAGGGPHTSPQAKGPSKDGTPHKATARGAPCLASPKRCLSPRSQGRGLPHRRLVRTTRCLGAQVPGSLAQFSSHVSSPFQDSPQSYGL